jgi:arylsulfatase A-like enzyme
MAGKPNILLITADQWRGDCLSAVGHSCVKTPNVDALASEGTLFARHYAGAAPCSPARATLYTGLYQMNHRVCRNGSPLDARFDNLALAARRAGYEPTLFGYTDTAPDPRGLDANDPHLTTYEGLLPGFTARQLLPEHEKQWLSWLRVARAHECHAAGISTFPSALKPGEISTAPTSYSKDETQTAFLTGEFIRWLANRISRGSHTCHSCGRTRHFRPPRRSTTCSRPPMALHSRVRKAVKPSTQSHPYLAYAMPKREGQLHPRRDGPGERLERRRYLGHPRHLLRDDRRSRRAVGPHLASAEGRPAPGKTP